MEIYIDVVFLINFVMDFFILWIVSKIIKRNISIKRILAASASASFLYCIMLFLSPLKSGNFFTALLLTAISVFICFRPKSIKEFVKPVLLSNVSAFTIGGAGAAIFYYTNIGYYLGNISDINIKHFSIKILIFSSCLCFIIFKILISAYNKASLKRQSFCSVNLYFGKNKIELTALIDTGNSLYEPASDKPVIISEFNSIKEILPEKIKLLYYENKDNNIDEIISAIDQCENKTDFALIPFSSLGRSKGIIVAIKAKRAEITTETTIKIDNPYVAIYNLVLSKDGNFNSLINPEILKY